MTPKRMSYTATGCRHARQPSPLLLVVARKEQLCEEICSSFAFYGTQFGQEVSHVVASKYVLGRTRSPIAGVIHEISIMYVLRRRHLIA